jgi:adenosine deaminase
VDLDALPKVVLHDHLDGGLRPATMIDLADAVGYRGLPASDPEGLAAAMYQGESRSLVGYLEAFRHTVAVMQTAAGLERVTREAIEDHAADGVVYAEIRFAPSLHLAGGMNRNEVLEAVLTGLRAGSEATGIPASVIVDAMRQFDDSAAVADLALEYRDDGVVGFDLAGPEHGFPASRHGEACRLVLDGGLHLTIHAGEAAGPESIADALEVGAERLGHGVRVVDDLTITDGVVSSTGSIATRVLEEGIPLEVCPLSNVHTSAVASIASHPVGILQRSGFSVTLNTDNRLMSQTSMSTEMAGAVEHHGFGLADLRAVTLRAVDAAFCDEDTRSRVRARVESGFDGA